MQGDATHEVVLSVDICLHLRHCKVCVSCSAGANRRFFVFFTPPSSDIEAEDGGTFGVVDQINTLITRHGNYYNNAFIFCLN